MTTIIMISKNNSVIINNGDDHDMESSVDPSTSELMSGYSTGTNYLGSSQWEHQPDQTDLVVC